MNALLEFEMVMLQGRFSRKVFLYECVLLREGCSPKGVSLRVFLNLG
jgi:hypothetical protein